MSCGLRHFGNDVMQLSYRHASICAKFSFNFLKTFFRDQRWPTALCSSWTSFFPSENSRHRFVTFVCEFPMDVHLLRWEIIWRNATHIWRDFGLALPFQTGLTQTKPVLPLSNEHGWQVKDQGRRQCCPNKHNKFPHRPTRDVSLLSGHASYFNIQI
jgi:hypothetical protein